MSDVQVVSSLEVLAEYLYTYKNPKGPESNLLNVLFVFEALKVFFNTKRLFFSEKRMLKTTEGSSDKIIFPSILDFNPNRYLNASTAQHLNSSTAQQLNTSTPQQLNSSTPQQLNTSTAQHLNTSTPNAILGEMVSTLRLMETSAKKFSSVSFNSPITKDGNLGYTSSIKLPGRKAKRTSLSLIAELIFITRPLIYCYLLKKFGSESPKAFLANLTIDALWLVLHALDRGLRALFQRETKARVWNLLLANLMRNPLYDRLVLGFLVRLVVEKFVPSRKLKDLVRQLLNFRSSLSFVM